MSYPNLVMLFKTIPSFDKDDEEKTDKPQDTIDVSEIGNYIGQRRSQNMAQRLKGKK